MQKLLMTALVDDSPLVHHHNAIHVDDGAQPMGDYERGPVPGKFIFNPFT